MGLLGLETLSSFPAPPCCHKMTVSNKTCCFVAATADASRALFRRALGVFLFGPAPRGGLPGFRECASCEVSRLAVYYAARFKVPYQKLGASQNFYREPKGGVVELPPPRYLRKVL